MTQGSAMPRIMAFSISCTDNGQSKDDQSLSNLQRSRMNQGCQIFCGRLRKTGKKYRQFVRFQVVNSRIYHGELHIMFASQRFITCTDLHVYIMPIQSNISTLKALLDFHRRVPSNRNACACALATDGMKYNCRSPAHRQNRSEKTPPMRCLLFAT